MKQHPVLLLFLIASFTVTGFSLDITITKIAEWGTGNYQDVFVKGNHAYCAASRAGLDIIDISKPASPRQIANINTPASAVCVFVQGNYVYVGDSGETANLSVIDITNPYSPIRVGVCTIYKVYYYYRHYSVDDVYVNGNYAYVISGQMLRVIDVTNPSSPTLVSETTVDYDPDDVYVKGNYAYVTTNKGEQDDNFLSLDIFDVHDPGSPALVGTFKTNYFWGMGGLDIQGSYAYVTNSGLTIVDISNPAAPVEVGRLPTIGGYDIKVSGNYAYISSFSKGLQVIDISDPTTMVPVGNGGPDMGGGVYISGNYAYMAVESKGLQVVDISNPGNPTHIGEFDQSGDAVGLDFSGNYVFLTHSEALHVIDVSTPDSPVLHGKIDTPFNPSRFHTEKAQNVHVCGNYAYVPSMYDGLEIIDISNAASPVLVGVYDAIQKIRDVYVSGNYAYMACKEGLHIIDISNPSSPVFAGSYNLDPLDDSSGIFVRGNFAYLTEPFGLIIFNISNPYFPTLVSSQSLSSSYNVFVSGDYAYVADGDAGLQIIDVSDPGSPEIVGNYDTAGSTNAVYVMGNYAYTADGANGLPVIDVSDPTSPTIVANYDTPGSVSGVHANGDYIYAADGKSGKLFILKLVDASTSPEINLNRSQLNFAHLHSAVDIETRSFIIRNSGKGTLNWLVSVNRDWLHCSPSSGKNSGEVTVSIDDGGFSPGTYFGTITVTAPGAINSPQTIAVTLNIYKTDQTSGPFGVFATPLDGTVVSGSTAVTGWVLDDIGIQGVEVFREEDNNLVYIGDAVLVEGARPDVEQAYPWYPCNYKAGWGYMMLTNFLPNGGNGTFNIHAIATDLEGNQTTLGIKTIICDNANAVKPFGTLDTPGQGGSASGSDYINWGWALTPPPNTIPQNGSTITVWVDGVPLGNPMYNRYRKDIDILFPGYTNSIGAGGYFYLDTTQYSDGVHTISWSVSDDAGNIDGIGSRYFTIMNTSQWSQRTAQSSSFPTPGFSKIPVDYSRPLRVKKGYSREVEPNILYPDETGDFNIQIKELERLEIHLDGMANHDASLTRRRMKLIKSFCGGVQMLHGAVFSKRAPLVTAGGNWQGFLVVGNRLKALPPGSFLDCEEAVFYWQPGPAFVGLYRLVFIETHRSGNMNRKNVLVRIIPDQP